MAVQGNDAGPDDAHLDEDIATTVHPDELPDLKTDDALRPMSLTLKVTKKANLGNYENAEASIIVSGVTAETTEEQLDALVANGKIAFMKMGEELRDQLTEIRDSNGYER